MRCPGPTLLLLASLAGACSGRPAASPDRGTRGSADALTLTTIREGAGLLFSFFDLRAELRTVDRLAQVPAGARAEVQVTDPSRPLPGDLVYLADLRSPGKDGKYRVWVERRGAWLDRAMPRLSKLPRNALASAGKPAAGAAKKPLKRIKKRRPRPRPALAGGAPSSGGRPRVLLFSTAWCPSCKAARAHLTARGVPFLELDVERNQEAAAVYQELQVRHRLKAGVVPMIVVDGRPVQGFSAPQLDALLAASGLASR
jgi:glutaredoxin